LVDIDDKEKIMRDTTKADNIYSEGTIITAKVDPALKLVIKRYYQRIYYCAVVNEPDRKHFAYFERELISPTQSTAPVSRP
jgi:hypothetical protein